MRAAYRVPRTQPEPALPARVPGSLCRKEVDLPIPRFVARSNRLLANPVVRRFAGRAPGFAIVIHDGRRSGRRYATPVNIVRSDTGFVIALTYGSDADWVANVLDAGSCAVVHRGSEVEAHHPRILDVGTGMAAMPAPVRVALRVLNVTEFLALDVV